MLAALSLLPVVINMEQEMRSTVAQRIVIKFVTNVSFHLKFIRDLRISLEIRVFFNLECMIGANLSYTVGKELKRNLVSIGQKPQTIKTRNLKLKHLFKKI